MRAKISLSAGLAVVALGFVVTSAQAHGVGVSVKDSYLPGTIVIRTGERRLYYFTGSGEAIRYPVGVGRARMRWVRHRHIDGDSIEPAWSPTASIRRDYPRLPGRRSGWLVGNPMGASRHDALRRRPICHPRHQPPGTIGGFVSHGCIRMYNEDVMDLYSRVNIGTRVVVTR